jgi:hypothetical protein
VGVEKVERRWWCKGRKTNCKEWNRENNERRKEGKERMSCGGVEC